MHMRTFDAGHLEQIKSQREKHDDRHRRRMTRDRESSRRQKIALIKELLPDVHSILCVGCRDDSEVRSFIHAGYDARGIDVATGTGLITRMDAHELIDEREDICDFIYCSGALEHMHDALLVLRGFKRIARVGAFIDLPTYEGPVEPDINHCSIFHVMEHDRARRLDPGMLYEFDVLDARLLHHSFTPDVNALGVGSLDLIYAWAGA